MEKHLQISGMSCHHCVNAVKTVLEGLDGVEVIDVKIGSANISSATTDETVASAIANEGYTVDSIA